MTAIVLPDIDRSTLEELKQKMPSLKLSGIKLSDIKLSDIELPSMEKAGHEADRTIDRLLGRSRPTIWPWVAAGLGIAAIIGAGAALMTWMRRPGWSNPIGTGYRSTAIPGSDTGTGTYGSATIAGTTESDITTGTGIGSTGYGGYGTDTSIDSAPSTTSLESGQP